MESEMGGKWKNSTAQSTPVCHTGSQTASNRRHNKQTREKPYCATRGRLATATTGHDAHSLFALDEVLRIA